MKIGVIGTGAVGGFYGGKLCRTGEEVHFLLRGDYEAVKSDGLRIENPDGGFTVNPHAHDAPESIGPCDLVLVALKSTANEHYAELISPLVGKRTAILCLQNGLGNYEQLAELFGPEKILGGLCFVCLNRTAPGVIQHLAFGKIIMGEYTRPPQKRTRAFAALFKESGVPCTVVENLEQGLWEKLVWNIPFNGLGVAAAAGLPALEGAPIPEPLGSVWPTDQLLADPKWENWVRALMDEIITAANAKSLNLDSALANAMIERTRAMGEYRASTLIDFENGQPLEMETMFHEPLRQALSTGVSVPRLEALVNLISQITHKTST
ncbi:MAG: 2-dehydropantoate 2-reductase [Verrucomicrobia subdivision 3 bacterium]|nr:2-dehydropantoate 2-reductase [Limisphaerales bacterium]